MKEDYKISVNVSPRTAKMSQKKLKKKLLYIFLLAGTSTVMSNYYKTEIAIECKDTPLNKWIIENCRELRKGIYKPTWFLPTTFMQCFYGAKIEAVPYVPFERDLVKLADGGVVSLDWCPPLQSSETEDNKILLILHGLTGGSECNYTRHAALNGQRNGFRSVVFNYRGFSSTPLATPKYHNFADTNDLKEVIQFIKQKYPKADIYGMGISVGGTMIVKYAGETGDKCELKAIVSIANPFNLEKCAHAIQKWYKYIYHQNILRGLLKNYYNNKEQLIKNPNIDPAKVESSKTVEEFDENLTIKLHNYATPHDYYRDTSCEQSIKNVKIPVLCLSSADDPIVLYVS